MAGRHRSAAVPPDTGRDTAVPAMLRRDPVLRLLVGLVVLCVLWFVLVPRQLRGPDGVDLWVPQPVFDLMVAVCAWRVGRMSVTSRPARRFYRTLCGCMLLFTVGDSVQAAIAVTHPGAGAMAGGTVQTGCFLVGMTSVVIVMLTYPAAARGRRDRLRFWLDAGTVLVGTGLLAVAAITPGLSVLGSVLVAGVLMTCGFAVAKLLLSGTAPMTVHAALPALAATGVQGLGIYLASTPSTASLGITLALRLLPSILFVAAPRIQELESRANPATYQPRRRHYTRLPYVMVVIAYGALLGVVPDGENAQFWVALAGVGAITALVVFRQLVGFLDNVSLISRLDASLDELGRQERRFRALLRHSSDIILVLDPDGLVRYASPAIDRLLGYRDDQVVGTQVTRFMHPDDLPVMLPRFRALAADPDGVLTYQARFRHADGRYRWLESISTNRLADPSVAGVVSNARDVTEARQMQERLHRQANHDALTGLANRALFAEQLSRVHDERSAHLALIDLDDFKLVNDRLGHGVGDELLIEVARRLVAAVRADDTVARLGGDEFALLMPDCTEPEADLLVERLGQRLRAPVVLGGHELLVRASIGVARLTGSADAAEMLRRADVAMYAAKEAGKGRHARYREELDVRHVLDTWLVAELRAALDGGGLDGDQLDVVYQPVVALPDGTVDSVEALVRWNHPERGAVPPEVFIPAAERSGLIAPLGAAILGRVCRQAVAWSAALGDAAPARIAVNVSGRQLRDPEFAGVVAGVLAETGLPAERLVLEVTESAVLDGGVAVRTVAEVRELGVLVALDDFGTGQSSQGLLRSCPVDMVKIDRSFVEGISGHGPQTVIASGLAQIATGLELRAVAEGVENAEQARLLCELGYRLAQGHHFAAPMSAGDLAALLAGTTVDVAA